MDQFSELLRLALYGAGRSRIKLAGVEFWFAKGTLVYSHPMSAWNQEAVSAEMAKLAGAGLQRASKAIG